MEDNTYRWPGSDPQPPKKPKMPDIKRLAKNILVIWLFLMLVAMAGTCFYTVDDKQQAVVTTFGKVTDVTDAGVHFKIPFGIQQVRKVDVNVYQKIELGYSSEGGKINGIIQCLCVYYGYGNGICRLGLFNNHLLFARCYLP